MRDHDRMALLTTRYGALRPRLFSVGEPGDMAGYRVTRWGGDRWMLRIFSRGRPLERVDGDARILALLADDGFPAERLVRTVNGEFSCNLDGRGVIVTEFIPGNPLGPTAEELTQLGSLLGRLVTLAALAPEARRPAGSSPEEDLRFGRRCLEEVEDLVPGGRRADWERLRRAIEGTGDCADLPRALIHPDCQPGNAIRRPDGRIELIDWTGAGSGPRIAALGVLLSGACLPGPDGGGGAPDRSRVEAVMRGFLRHVRLESEEVARLADAVRYRPLVLAARDFSVAVRSGGPAPSADRWDRYELAEVVADWVKVALRRARPEPAAAHDLALGLVEGEECEGLKSFIVGDGPHPTST